MVRSPPLLAALIAAISWAVSVTTMAGALAASSETANTAEDRDRIGLITARVPGAVWVPRLWERDRVAQQHNARVGGTALAKVHAERGGVSLLASFAL